MTTGRRLLVGICAALLGAAAALWAASASTWFGATMEVAERGRLSVDASGADLEPALTGVAVLAVAGVAAAVALSGLARRVLGLVLALAALWTGLAVVGRMLAPPSVGELAAAVPGGSLAGPDLGSAGDGVTGTGAPLLGVAGVLLMLAAAGALVVAERVLPRFGARYAVARARPGPADPARAAWQDLDAGRDPTVDRPEDVPRPDGERPIGPV